MTLPAFRFRALELADFRCFQRAGLAFPEGACWLVGGNGEGKTSMLEALHVLARGVSFRRGRSLPLVRMGAQRFRLRARALRLGPLELEAEGNGGGITIRLQRARVRARRELAELVPVVADSPHMADLVQGSDAERRRWLDRLLVLADPGGAQARRDFLRALLQRARALRRGYEEEAHAWAPLLVDAGWRWLAARMRLGQRINAWLREEAWAGELRLAVEEEDEGGFRQRMQAALRHRVLDAGPHLAPVGILREGRDARLAASRGQQRLCAIALRLAECRLWMETRRIVPCLLLDDAAEALDRRRRQQLARRLEAYPGQVIASAQEPPDDDAHWQPIKGER